MKITRGTTARGFAVLQFGDFYGNNCSLQKSSLATEDAVWLGIDNANPLIMARDAHRFGIQTVETTGWVPYPIPSEVNLTTRMHLNIEQAQALIELLTNFVETGEV